MKDRNGDQFLNEAGTSTSAVRNGIAGDSCEYEAARGERERQVFGGSSSRLVLKRSQGIKLMEESNDTSN